jgi:ketosteroid isomerase-like protein
MKKTTWITNLVCAVLTACLSSCWSHSADTKADRQKDLAAVEEAIHGAIGWAKNKDFPLLYSIIANDPEYLEVDPTPGVIRGFAEFKKNEAFWGSPEFKAVRYDIRDLKTSLSASGDVAWFYCVLDDVNEWKGRPASWLNTRWTGVLEKRKETWVLVQMHFSFAQTPQKG